MDASELIRAGNLTELKRLDKIEVSNYGDLTAVVTRKKCVKMLEFLKDKVDLTDKGGLLLFQAVFAHKYDNAHFLADLMPSDSPSIGITLLNLFGSYWADNSKYHTEITDIATKLAHKLTSEDLDKILAHKLPALQSFEKILLEGKMPEVDGRKIHKI